jgi:outer membrane lipoprotein-sorting protein
MLARIAACVTLVAALGIIPLSGLWRVDRDGTLLADMIDTVKKTQNASFRTTSTSRMIIDGQKQKPQTQVVRYWLTNDGLSRVEYEGWITTICNRKEGKVLVYNPTTKKAHMSKAPKPFLDMYQHLKNLDVRRYNKLAEKTIDGRRAAGFVVPEGDKLYGAGVEIWIDVETKLPLRIEGRSGDKDDPDQVDVSDQFVFDNANLDYALFDLRVPDGYALQETPVIESMWIEDDGQIKTSEEQRTADATIVLAGMIKNVQNAKNVSLRFKGKARSTINGKKMAYSESAYREWIDASGSTRQELDRGSITVVNRKQNKVMVLDKNTKKANIIELPKDEPFDNIYENLKNLKLENLEKVPEKEIDGRMAIGFVVPTANDREKQVFMPGVKVWVDQDTRLPIKIEGSFGRDKDEPDGEFVIDEIVFDDPKVVPSLFEIKVPEGYTLQEVPILEFTPGTKPK